MNFERGLFTERGRFWKCLKMSKNSYFAVAAQLAEKAPLGIGWLSIPGPE